MITLDLTQNDFGSNTAVFSALLNIFQDANALEELNLSQSLITDKHLEELATCLQSKRDLALSRLNLSNNKLTYKGAYLLFAALNQSKSKISSIVLDRSNLQKPVQNDPTYALFCRSVGSTLSLNRELTQLSLNYCNLGMEMLVAIGEGLLKNTKLRCLKL